MRMTGAIFDLDGTLIDSLYLWDVLWEAFSERYRRGKPFRPDPEADKTIRTIPLADAMEYLHHRFDLGPSGCDLLETANTVFRNFYASEVQLKPGVMEFLKTCRENGVKMCIASATDPKLLQVAMEHCGISDFFPKIFSCSELGRGKEVPDIFLMAREYLGTPQAETFVFEDSYVALQTAARAGFPTVGIFDRFGFCQETMRETADVYIKEGGSMMDALEIIDVSEQEAM